MSESRRTPSPQPTLLDTLSYPRDFSLSLVCSLLLHVAAAAVLLQEAAQNIGLYTQERTAIVRAQDVGPSFEGFSMEATSANLVFARYARHFAGKDRSTRDLALLGENTIDDARALRAERVENVGDSFAGIGQLHDVPCGGIRLQRGRQFHGDRHGAPVTPRVRRHRRRPL